MYRSLLNRHNLCQYMFDNETHEIDACVMSIHQCESNIWAGNYSSENLSSKSFCKDAIEKQSF